jgi:hypothetical protein
MGGANSDSDSDSSKEQGTNAIVGRSSSVTISGKSWNPWIIITSHDHLNHDDDGDDG